MATSTRSGIAADVAAEVRAAVARAHVKQTDLAAHLGMSTASLSRRLNAYRPFQLDEVQRIAEYLSVPLASLIPSGQDAA